MAFGWLKKLGSGISKGVHIADQVISNPVLGPIISTIPIINSAGGFIHLTDKLLPHPDSNEQRRATAIDALRAEYPTYSDETLGKLVDAMVLLRKLGVKAVQ